MSEQENTQVNTNAENESATTAQNTTSKPNANKNRRGNRNKRGRGKGKGKGNKANQLVFYDVETTVSASEIIEFGAVVVNKKGLYETESYSTLIKSSNVTAESIKLNGITAKMLANAPTFASVADKIFEILNGRVWVGHNIKSFDNKKIEKEFKKLNKEPPKPSAIIDTMQFIRKHFKRRAGSLKLADLAQYFGLGAEKHRAIADARLAFEVWQKVCLTLAMEEKCDFTSTSEKSNSNNQSTEASSESKEKPEKTLSKKFIDIKAKLQDAMDNKKTVWVSSTAIKEPKHAVPLVPFELQPISWVEEEANKFIAIKPGDSTELQFSLFVIGEVQDAKFETARHQLDKLFGKKIYIRYFGNPKPRAITPQKWDENKDHLFLATCHLKEDVVKNFNICKIGRISETEWQPEKKTKATEKQEE